MTTQCWHCVDACVLCVCALCVCVSLQRSCRHGGVSEGLQTQPLHLLLLSHQVSSTSGQQLFYVQCLAFVHRLLCSGSFEMHIIRYEILLLLSRPETMCIFDGVIEQEAVGVEPRDTAVVTSWSSNLKEEPAASPSKGDQRRSV